MARLSIRLFGSFQVRLDAAPITNFDSDKVRALLAYLVVEGSQAHSREKLAALFWPEMPAKRAMANVSQALYNLRRLIEDNHADPSYLLRSRKTVQFNTVSDYWLDVNAFIERLGGNETGDRFLPKTSDEHLKKTQAAVELYRGDFLGSLAGECSVEFDEWVLMVRQRLQRQALDALHLLTDCYAERGEIALALPYAWRRVELDPLGEPACRQLMRLLAASDQRSQALAQYERLRVLLAEELYIEPEAETVELRDRIAGKASLPSQRKIRNHGLPASG